MRKIKFTRDDVKDLVSEIKSAKVEYVNVRLLIGASRDGFVLTTNYKEKDIIYSEPLIRIFNSLGLGGAVNHGNGEWHQFIVGDARKALEDKIYYDINRLLEVINKLGFVASEEVVNAIIHMINNVHTLIKSEYLMNKEVSYRDLGISDKVLDLYRQENEPYFSNGVEVDTAKGVLRLSSKVKGIKLVNYVRKELKYVSNRADSEARGYGADTIKVALRIIGSVENVREHYDRAIINEIKSINSKLGGNHTILFKALDLISSALFKYRRIGTLLDQQIEKLVEYNEEYKDKGNLDFIKPVLHPKTSKPYMLIKGDLDKYTYEVTRGNAVYGEYASKMRGVTKVGEDEYITTLHAFTKLDFIDDFHEDLKFADFSTGDWDRLIEVDGNYYRAITTKLTDKIDKDKEFTIITFNVGKESSTLFGLKLPLFQATLLGYGNNYKFTDDDESEYGLLSEMYNVANKEGYFANKYEEWLVMLDKKEMGYNEKEIERVNRDIEELENIYTDVESEVISKYFSGFGSGVRTYEDLAAKDAEMGLDCGFVFVEYEDDKRNMDIELYNKEHRGDKYINMGVFYPRVQSLTIKTPIAKHVLKIFNEKHPDRKLKMRTVLD